MFNYIFLKIFNSRYKKGIFSLGMVGFPLISLPISIRFYHQHIFTGFFCGINNPSVSLMSYPYQQDAVLV